jgi:hypothetical protein
MKANVQLRELDKPELEYYQSEEDIEHLLEVIGFPKKHRNSITGAIVRLIDGDIESVWLSESNRPYDLNSTYHPLPYFMPSNRSKKYLPFYWMKDNSDYN